MEDLRSSSNLLDEAKGGVSAVKRLDTAALYRLCMSEQLLSRLQQPQQRNEEKCFQHVKAKFNGVVVEGGLGTACLVAQDGERGVAWLQVLKTDLNAQDRRKKELQDITNRRSAPKADTNLISALFVALQDVAKAKKVTTGQNAVRAIELELLSGHRLELSFMPGPHFRATHCDELLALLNTQLAAPQLTKGGSSAKPELVRRMREEASSLSSPSKNSSASLGSSSSTTRKESAAEYIARSRTEYTPVRYSASARPVPVQPASRTSVAVGARTPSSGTVITSHKPEEKEEFRRLVRRYTQLNELSVEAVAIAKQLHEKTGYHVGPIAKECPKFSADVKYRKKTVTELSNFLKRMNQEWNDADTQRELHTKVKYSRNEDELFEYRDTETGALVSTQTYETRYLKYVKAHEVEAVLHLCPVPARVARREEPVRGNPATATALTGADACGTRSIPTDVEKSATAVFMATLGIDISSSLIIDQEMFAPRAFKSLADVPALAGEDTAYRTAVNKVRVQLWERLGDAFASIRKPQTDPVGSCMPSGSQDTRENSRLSSFVRANAGTSASDSARTFRREDQAQSRAQGEPFSATRKRSRDRRQSLFREGELPNVDELQSNQGVTAAERRQRIADAISVGAVEARAKSERLASHDKEDSTQKPRRKMRRQSIVNVVTLPSTPVSEGRGGSASKRKMVKHGTPPRTRRSPRRKRPVVPYPST